MPIKRPQLINNQIYHIVLKTIEGLKLFRDERDYLRMIHDLFEFNDEDPVSSNFRVSQKLILTRKLLVILVMLTFWENLVRGFGKIKIVKFSRGGAKK